jgi:hypothetical protein
MRKKPQRNKDNLDSYFANTIIGKGNINITYITAIHTPTRQAQCEYFAHFLQAVNVEQKSLESMFVKKLARKKDRPRHYSASIVSSSDAILATHWFDDAIAHRVRFELCVLSSREAIHVKNLKKKKKIQKN